MGDFEILERDGLARIGRLATPHGPLDTPALLPVVHPDPARQAIAPSEIRRRFGLGAVITSAYITYRTPPLRARAEEAGIHGLLGFDGPVMTDSGAFQQHAYGHVEVEPDEILGFQRRIGSDIATVLDIFVEPSATPEQAEEGVAETTRRAKEARTMHRGLLAVPVQGGLLPELRFRSASEASETGDILAVGGVVPLMEQYPVRRPGSRGPGRAARAGPRPRRPPLRHRPSDDVRVRGAARGRRLRFVVVHRKFARRGSLMFPNGTLAIDSLREATCRCFLCAEVPLPEVARRPAAERERRIAEHNLLMCAAEVSEVRQAIRDGALWELAERRAGGHPALIAGLRAVVRGVRAFLPTEPESRTSFRYVGPTSGLRPSVIRFLARVERWKSGKGTFRAHPLVPLLPGRLATTPTTDRSGSTLRYQALTAFGPVPLELTDLYPVGCYVGPDEFDAGPTRRLGVEDAGREAPDLERVDYDPDRDWKAEWELRIVDALLEFHFGAEARTALDPTSFKVERSRRTGRLRSFVRDRQRIFIVGPDGVPRPTFFGARILQAALPYPGRRLLVAPDAVEFVARGKSLFSKFVAGGDSSLVPGGSAMFVSEDDRLLAVGRLLLAPHEMGRLTRGVAARVTAHEHAPEPAEEPDEPPSVEGPAPPSDEP